MNEQCRGPTLAEAIFFFPVFRVQSHTVNVWYSLSSIEARYAPWLFWKKKMDKKTKKVLYSLEMLTGNATSSSLDFYGSKDRVTATHHLVGKTWNSGLECHTGCDAWGCNFSPLLSLSNRCQDILCGGISTRMVCVNGRQVSILKPEMRSTKGNTNLLTLLEKASAKTASSK